ncbi:MAG TPA: ABC transporter ATP-binding protein [Anaerolineales bacterium]|nr:ABC transporter ATP-binding protein [Anaerolineales bacterium]
MSVAAIETDQLRKEFGDNIAVEGLTLQVAQGEVFGFLGPNGAGKTTSIKMLLGLVAPTSGKAALLGAPIGDRATLARVGFLPEHFRFQDWLTAGEFLWLHGELLGMERQALKTRRDELLERVGLAPFRNKQLRTFSKGMLQRIGLAQALLNHPALVFLDEPTSGLDPVGRRLVRDVIHELRNEGTCVFLNSHLLSEIEVTCDRVAFIRHGEVVRTLELASLNGNQSVVTIRASGLTPTMVSEMARWGRDIQANGEQLTLTVHNEASIPEINRYLVAQGASVFAISPSRLSLEDIFIETVGKDGGL